MFAGGGGHGAVNVGRGGGNWEEVKGVGRKNDRTKCKCKWGGGGGGVTCKKTQSFGYPGRASRRDFNPQGLEAENLTLQAPQIIIFSSVKRFFSNS